jgi:hypothetical protein
MSGYLAMRVSGEHKTRPDCDRRRAVAKFVADAAFDAGFRFRTDGSVLDVFVPCRLAQQDAGPRLLALAVVYQQEIIERIQREWGSP